MLIPSDKIFTFLFLFLFLLIVTVAGCQHPSAEKSFKDIEQPDNLLVHVVDLNKTDLNFYYKNQFGTNYKNHENLKIELIFLLKTGNRQMEISVL